MNLHELAPGKGSRRQKRRLGRGHGSGRGKTAGKGTKGQNARSGGGVRLGFEGGQNPWTMRIPHKRGFHRGRFRVEAQVVNLHDLERSFSAGDSITLRSLQEIGLIGDTSGKRPVKLLGQGRLTKRLTLEVHAASRSARAAVEAAGGSLTLLAPAAQQPRAAQQPQAPQDPAIHGTPAQEAEVTQAAVPQAQTVEPARATPGDETAGAGAAGTSSAAGTSGAPDAALER